MQIKPQSNYQSGKYAEKLVCSFLRLKRYNILCTNFITGRGTGAGEVDIIALKKDTVVFIEIKKRKDLETAAYAISEKQKQRIYNGAESFLQKHPEYQNHNARFDAILVELPFKINHIQNAW